MNASTTTIPLRRSAPQAAKDAFSTMVANPFGRVLIYALLIDLLWIFSRAAEFFVMRLGTDFYMVRLTHAGALGLSIVSGGAFLALRSQTGRWLTGFTIWMIVVIPFSFWKMAAINMLTKEWLVTYTAFLIAAGTPLLLKDITKVIGTLMLSLFAVLTLTRMYGQTVDNRLALSGGTLANSNYLAAFLLLTLAFAMYPFLMNRRGVAAIVTRIVSLVVTGMGALAVLNTGSRTGLLVMVTMFVVYVLSVSGRQRLVVLALSIIAVPALIVAVPGQTLNRLKTLAGTEDRPNSEAVESTEGRVYLLKQSLGVTMTHPIFGVGPGSYTAAAANRSTTEGERPKWLASHNTYTQVSAETGIPGIILYAGFLASLFASLKRIRGMVKQNARVADARAAEVCFRMSLFGFCLTSMFANNAYLPMMPMLAGLIVALERAVKYEIQQSVPGAAAPSKPRSWSMPGFLYSRQQQIKTRAVPPATRATR